MAARQQRRKVIAHVGPTNSGKTYKALQSFMKAESGVYCGPLRLLAHEVYEKVRTNVFFFLLFLLFSFQVLDRSYSLLGE